VLPVARCGRRLASQLGTGGYDVTYEEFDGGHVVRPEDVAAALTTWLGPADRRPAGRGADDQVT
jgi:predicted esterase